MRSARSEPSLELGDGDRPLPTHFTRVLDDRTQHAALDGGHGTGSRPRICPVRHDSKSVRPSRALNPPVSWRRTAHESLRWPDVALSGGWPRPCAPRELLEIEVPHEHPRSLSGLRRRLRKEPRRRRVVASSSRTSPRTRSTRASRARRVARPSSRSSGTPSEGFDRRMDSRRPIFQPPTVDGDTLTMALAGDLHRGGASGRGHLRGSDRGLLERSHRPAERPVGSGLGRRRWTGGWPNTARG